ncbi:hypothetical protein [uncultured Campylobacter sp.]|uniref:hypothetical protein n=1 Tax=uncultured Campylobacter sp. TaxID=218934 RepID=UPI00260E8CBF|nr:hypothetical protein [uncultured Campylobacter sp.]
MVKFNLPAKRQICKKQAGQKLLEVKFGLGKFEITNLEIYKNPPVKFNGRGKFKGA